MTAYEIETVLEKVPEGLVQDPVTSVSVEVPDDAGEGVGIPTADGNIQISLPSAAESESATTLGDGTVVYPSREGVADAVVPLPNGVQVLTFIANRDAPTIYRSELALKDGQRLIETSDGGVQVVDSESDPVLVLTAPWAKDANGRTVPTHYEIDGNAVVQMVGHVAAGVAYPVVADPTYYYWWGGKRSFSSSQANRGTVVAALTALNPPFAPAAVVTGAALQWCNSGGRGIWVYWTWAGQVWCTSQ